MGIGGTGVVTVNQVLATAAQLEGLRLTGLDQTGLSQKAGPVVSHLKLHAEADGVAGRVSAEAADLYLAFDELVAVEARHLAHGEPGHTIAVVSTSEVPTGAMVRDHDKQFPGVASVRERIDGVSTPDRNAYLDAIGLAEELFANHLAANLLLVGAAYQVGGLPMSADAIERAIELNGVAVELNRRAFRWGRAAVARPEALPAIANASQTPRTVDDLIEHRATELVAFQNRKVADRYRRFMFEVRTTDAQVAGDDLSFTDAVARNLYKLTAYKDEYEVARLFLDPRFVRPAGKKFRYHLHPPVLRSLGLSRKIRLRPWFRHVFAALYAMRWLRRTPFDPFRWAKVRRVERGLVKDYRRRIERELQSLSPATYQSAVELASLPDMIRGYEGVKLANVERYQAALDARR